MNVFVGVVRKVRAELGRVYGQGCVFGVVTTVQSLKASVCVCVWDCENGTKLSCVFRILNTEAWGSFGHRK